MQRARWRVRASRNPGGLGGNGLLSQNTLFNTTLNNLDNLTNDLKISKHLEYDSLGSFDLAAGYFHSTQENRRRLALELLPGDRSGGWRHADQRGQRRGQTGDIGRHRWL